MKVFEVILKTMPEDLQKIQKKWHSLQPLKFEYQERLWQRLRMEWNYHSNYLEGNTLSYGETVLLLMHGRTQGEHLIREYEEMKGHDSAIIHIQKLAQNTRVLSEEDIQVLNKMLFKQGFWKIMEATDGSQKRRWVEPGTYKTEMNYVFTKTGEPFYFACPEEIDVKMKSFVKWLNGELKKPTLSLGSFLAKLHHGFICIHPFDDGNGRIARLLVNYVLLKLKLLPIVIASDTRKDYLKMLQIGDSGNLEPLSQFLLDRLRCSLKLGIKASKHQIGLV